MCRISDIGVFLLLLLCSVSDIRTRTISTRFLTVMSLALAVFRMAQTNGMFISVCCGILIGVLFVFISKCTKEAIGYADSWIILLLGGYLGVEKLLLLVSIAFFLAGICSLMGLLWKKWRRKSTIPFVPFLALAYAGVVFI